MARWLGPTVAPTLLAPRGSDSSGCGVGCGELSPAAVRTDMPTFSRHSALSSPAETAACTELRSDNDAACIPDARPIPCCNKGRRQVYACIYRAVLCWWYKRNTVCLCGRLYAATVSNHAFTPARPRHRRQNRAGASTHLITDIRRKLVPPPGSLVSLSSSHVTMCLPSGRASAIVAKRPMFLPVSSVDSCKLTQSGPRIPRQRRPCPPFPRPST